MILKSLDFAKEVVNVVALGNGLVIQIDHRLELLPLDLFEMFCRRLQRRIEQLVRIDVQQPVKAIGACQLHGKFGIQHLTRHDFGIDKC